MWFVFCWLDFSYIMESKIHQVLSILDCEIFFFIWKCWESNKKKSLFKQDFRERNKIFPVFIKIIIILQTSFICTIHVTMTDSFRWNTSYIEAPFVSSLALWEKQSQMKPFKPRPTVILYIALVIRRSLKRTICKH